MIESGLRIRYGKENNPEELLHRVDRSPLREIMSHI